MIFHDFWRVDATHDLGGAFCQYRRNRSDADTVAFTLRNQGWKCATRPAGDLHINEAESVRLCNGLWPITDSGAIVTFLRSNREQVRDQLLDAVYRRDLRDRGQTKYGSKTRR